MLHAQLFLNNVHVYRNIPSKVFHVSLAPLRQVLGLYLQTGHYPLSYTIQLIVLCYHWKGGGGCKFAVDVVSVNNLYSKHVCSSYKLLCWEMTCNSYQCVPDVWGVSCYRSMVVCYEYSQKAGATRWQTLSRCLIAFCSFGLIEGIHMKSNQHIRRGVYFALFSWHL
jgi:hypothetical protein